MYKSTVESDSTHRRWLPGRKDHGNRILHIELYTSDTETLQRHKKQQTLWNYPELAVQQQIICGTKQITQNMEKATEWPATR